MVHWGFLILAFILGFAACYGILYILGNSAGGFLEWINKSKEGENE